MSVGDSPVDRHLGTGVSGDAAEDFPYDARSRLNQAKDDDPIVNLIFDSVSRVHTEVQGAHPLGTTGRTVSCAWSDSADLDLNAARDSLGRISAINDGSSATAASFDLCSAMARETRRTLSSRTSNAVGRRTSITSAPAGHGSMDSIALAASAAP
ncbi:MAG: hypothetical protein K8T90_06935 [Planctomycetes bacterium]|nr:hypothetical protein [Planctomycetota bacterium]